MRQRPAVYIVLFVAMIISAYLTTYLLYWLYHLSSPEHVPQPKSSSCSTVDCVDFGEWEDSGPECANGQCMCRNGTCTHYTVGDWGKIHYYCGTCGSLGSSCDEIILCENPGKCLDDFCRCPFGEVVYEICIDYQPVSSVRKSLILIAVLMILLILGRLIAWRKYIFQCLRIDRWLCYRWYIDRTAVERNEVYLRDGTSDRPNSQKTAAYTVSSGEFIAASNDPDLEWAMELSRQIYEEDDQRRAQQPSTSFDSEHAKRQEVFLGTRFYSLRDHKRPSLQRKSSTNAGVKNRGKYCRHNGPVVPPSSHTGHSLESDEEKNSGCYYGPASFEDYDDSRLSRSTSLPIRFKPSAQLDVAALAQGSCTCNISRLKRQNAIKRKDNLQVVM